MSTFFEILDRVQPRWPESVVEVPAPENRETARRALVTQTPDRTVLTVPVATANLNAEDFVTRISGRLVGADEPNRNKQFWSTADLEFGLPSVAGGPLNWLHDDRHIVGALMKADLLKAKAETLKQAAADSAEYQGTHIKADSVLWSYIFPAETRIVQDAAQTKNLYYSMECISKKVACAGETGCGHEMDYADAIGRTERACAHIRDKASARRFINPIFQGAAIIIPPVKPGWKDANAGLVKAAAAYDALQEWTDGDELLAAQILEFTSTAR